MPGSNFIVKQLKPQTEFFSGNSLRFIALLTTMAKNLLKSTSLFAGNTFASRILGLIREMVFAYFFGATAGFDAFLVAFRLSNFMRRLFAEGAFSQAFVPILSEYRTKKSHATVRQFINDMTGSLGVILLLITMIAILTAPLIIGVFAPGFIQNGSRFALASSMLRITFPYLLLISLTALSGAILNAYDSFGVPSFTPVLLNVTLIIAAVWISPHFHIPEYALAWGVLIAGIIQLLFQFPFLYQKQLLPKPHINFKDPGVKKVVKLMVPALFGVSIVQISLLLNTMFASFLRVGSVSWLYYSDRLMNFPLGVFGVAIATVILPKLSRQHTNNHHDDYAKTLDWALRLLILVGLPSTIAMFMLAGPLISTLFQSGKFGTFDVLMARKSLMAFAIGIQAFMLIKVFASGFYAKQDIKTPVKIAAIAFTLNILFNALLIVPLAHTGLALATSISAFINAGLLLTILIRRKIYKPQPGWLKFCAQLLLANVLMVIFLYFYTDPLSTWLSANRWYRISHLFILVASGVIIYFSSLWAARMKFKHFIEEGK